MGAGHFTTLTKDPSLQGENSRNGSFAPGGAPARDSFFAKEEAPAKNTAPVEQGTREW